MFRGEENSIFLKFPPELIINVLRFAGMEGKRNARLVCKRWQLILDHPGSALTKFNTRINSTDSVKTILNSNLHFECLEVNSDEVTVKTILNSNLQFEVNSAEIIWPTMTYSRNKFPSFKKISFIKESSEQTVVTILQYGCVYTKVLSISGSTLSKVRPHVLSRVLAETKWNKLSDLSFTAESSVSLASILGNLTEDSNTKRHIAGIECFLQKAMIPNLRIFRFTMTSFSEAVAVFKLMEQFTIFIDRHAKTLKELYMFLYVCPVTINLNYNLLGTTLFSAERQDSITQNLKLESIEIVTSHYDVLRYFVPPCLWKSDKLTKLVWVPILSSLAPFGFNSSAQNPVKSVIQNSRHTLTNVEIWFSSDDLAEFNLTWLGPCTSLKELSLFKFDKALNVSVRLPTVKNLEVYADQPNTIDDGCAWISRTFPNLETIKILRLTTDQNNHGQGQCDWLESLLLLPKLRQIIFCFNNKECEDFIRKFCRDKPRLVLIVVDRHRLSSNVNGVTGQTNWIGMLKIKPELRVHGNIS